MCELSDLPAVGCAAGGRLGGAAATRDSVAAAAGILLSKVLNTGTALRLIHRPATAINRRVRAIDWRPTRLSSVITHGEGGAGMAQRAQRGQRGQPCCAVGRKRPEP